MRKLRRADELAAEGKTGEEIAAELGVSAARCTTGGALTAGWTPTRPRSSRNSASRSRKRPLAEAELEKDALREVAKGKF